MTEPQARRELILSAAAELFARKGIQATTVRDIGDAVGVLSGSLYHYFVSKDQMVRQILREFLDAIRERYDAVLTRGDLTVPQALADLVSASLEVAVEQPDATTIYQNELRYLRQSGQYGDIVAAAADVQQAWMGIIERGVADGTFRADISPRILHRLIRDAVWLSGRGTHANSGYPTEQLSAAITAVFLQGYAASGGAVPARVDGTRVPAV